MPEELAGLESAPVESGGESYLSALQADADAAFAALDDSPAPVAEGTTDEPAETEPETTTVSGSDDTALESVDAQLAGGDDEVITRRNARELVEKARAEKEEAISKAAELEAQQKQQSETWQRLQEQAAQWNPDPAVMAEIDRATKARDWDTLAKHNLYSVDDALDRLQSMEEQKSTNTAMLGYWHGVFIGQFGPAYQKAAERAGIPWAELQAESDPEKTITRLLDAEATRVRTEEQGKYTALKSEYDALKARAGGPSPESGGAGASSSAVPKTVQELERMSNADFEKNFDKILAAIPT
jgi:hypothetical protein